MKRFLLVLLSGFITILGYSQVNADFDKVNIRTNFGGPINDTLSTPYKIGEMRTRPQDNLLYRYNGKTIGNQRWDFVYFGPSNSIVSTLDQVLNRGNLSSIGVNVGPSIFASIKIPSLGVTGQILMVTVLADGTLAAQTVPGGGSTIGSINTLTASAQFLATSFSVATSPKFLSVTATHTLNLPIANSLDTGIVTPAQIATWNGKTNLPGSGTSLQYLRGDTTWQTFPFVPDSGKFTTSGGGITITGNWPNKVFSVTGGGGGGFTSLTNDVVASGTGAVVATIQPNVVTYAKIQQAGGGKILGNPTGSTANISEFGLGSGVIFNGGLLKADTTLLLTISKATTYMKYTDTATMLSVYYRKPGGTTLQYIRGDGTLATADTTMIPNFFLKARSELTGDAYILYNQSTGHISTDTSAGKLATQTQLLSYTTVTRFLDSLANADTIQTLRPLYVKHGVKDTIAAKNDSAAWNAKSLLGILLNNTAPTDQQILAYDQASNTWKAINNAGGGGTSYTFTSSILNTSGTVTLVNDNAAPGNSMIYGTGPSGTKGWFAFNSLPVATLTTPGLLSPQEKARLDSTLSMANVRIAGTDTLTYSIISSNPAVTDSLYFRSLKLIGGNGITITDQSLPQTITKLFLLDTSANVAHALTQGMASNLYQLKLSTFTTSTAGLVPASGGGTINFLRADGTFTVPLNLYNSDGSITGNRTITIGANELILSGGTAVSNGLWIQSSLYLSNPGISDANLTIGDGYSFYQLPNISANRTITLPNPAVLNDAGRILQIYSPSVSFIWSFASSVVYSDLSTVCVNLKPSTMYTLQAMGGQWVIVNAFTAGDQLRYKHTLFTPTTGNTITLLNNQYNIIKPAGALSALTITLPASPTNNDVIYIKSTQTVTTLTVSGGTVGANFTTNLPAGTMFMLTYDSITSTWY